LKKNTIEIEAFLSEFDFNTYFYHIILFSLLPFFKYKYIIVYRLYEEKKLYPFFPLNPRTSAAEKKHAWLSCLPKLGRSGLAADHGIVGTKMNSG